ncbi:MAG: hypothetical protein L3J17_03450 [Candidatus Jettenia sp.]|nr:MAG: hypothetical protein L3J17_03450 [Candidatus Jettenia sp.]
MTPIKDKDILLAISDEKADVKIADAIFIPCNFIIRYVHFYDLTGRP